MTVTGTGLNSDLAKEILRIKDNLIMYPDQRNKLARHLTVRMGETPADQPKTLTEWFNDVIIDRKASEPIPWIEPIVKEEVQPIKKALTSEQKALLKSLSYKFHNKPAQFILAA